MGVLEGSDRHGTILKHFLFQNCTCKIDKKLIFVDIFFSSLEATGCSLNIVFFSKDFGIFQTLAYLCFPLLSECVHTPGNRAPSPTSHRLALSASLRVSMMV